MARSNINRSRHIDGFLLVVASAVVFSTAGLFTKGISVGAWDIIFWRGVFAAAFTVAYALSRGTFRADFVEMGASGWAAALVGASGTAAFIPAFKYTTIANVSLIYAATPLLAAILSWLWIGEKVSRPVLAGCIATLLGVAIIVGGSLGSVNLRGDLLACWMALAMAIMFVIYRRYPKTPAAGPSALSSLVLLPVGLFFGTPLIDTSSQITWLAVFGLVFALASVTLSEGARRLPASETALLSLLEVPLAPLLAWAIFAERPTINVLVGGGLILASVIATQVRKSSEAPKPEGT
jgi:drug/metabolite transporter (DMT)-like permease